MNIDFMHKKDCKVGWGCSSEHKEECCVQCLCCCGGIKDELITELSKYITSSGEVLDQEQYNILKFKLEMYKIFLEIRNNEGGIDIINIFNNTYELF
jgi:hypothetical protein